MEKLLNKLGTDERINISEAKYILENLSTLEIGRFATFRKSIIDSSRHVSFVVDTNPNYTNVCETECLFCAFWRKEGINDAYTLEIDKIIEILKTSYHNGATTVLLQGGHNPKLKIDYYVEIIKRAINEVPGIHLHAFSAPEIASVAKYSEMSTFEVLKTFWEAGLRTIPGGGAEILVDRVRSALTRGKCMTDEWLEVMRVWHQLGGISTATMMFGHLETLEERIEHLNRLREVQDETQGFTAFICWTFQPDNTELSHLPAVGSFEYLKTQAVSRLYLDNIPNIQSSWVTQGLKVGQLAMLFGANDMGSLMIEENVVAEAGTVHYLSLQQIREAISELGYTPRQRNIFYELFDESHERQALEANQRAAAQLPALN